MSYILDALRKSSEERQKLQEHGLNAHDPFPPVGIPAGKSNRGILFALLMLTIILVFLVLLGFWWYAGTIKPGQETTVPIPQETREDIAAGQPLSNTSADGPGEDESAGIQLTPPSGTGEAEEELSRTASPLIEQPTPLIIPQQKQQTSADSIPLLEDLPPEIRAEIPTMKFSGHVYSPNASLRMIMVNTAVVREGAMIAPEIYLDEITENGLLLRYRTTVFRVELF